MVISCVNFSQSAFLKFHLGLLMDGVAAMTAGWVMKVGRCWDRGRSRWMREKTQFVAAVKGEVRIRVGVPASGMERFRLLAIKE